MLKQRKPGAPPSPADEVRAGDEEGSTLVEFALVFPVLAMLLLGIIEFGILFHNYITLTNAVAVGARTLSVSRAMGTGPPTACTLAQTAITNAAVNLNTTQLKIATPTFPSPGTSTCSNLVSGDAATVQATYPCNLFIFGTNYATGCTLTSQTTIRIE